MDMNPVCLGEDSAYVYKDAIIFSGHKFIGGPGCPGVLVVKRTVLPPQDSLPTEPGGGTYFVVLDFSFLFIPLFQFLLHTVFFYIHISKFIHEHFSYHLIS